jgi:hypothetical protein
VTLLIITGIKVSGTNNNGNETVFCMMTKTGPIPPTNCGKDVDPILLSKSTVVIDGVPAYRWYNGCSPTAAGMLIGYWDSHGYPNLVDGDASTQTDSVKDMISSTGNYEDYCLPIDNEHQIRPDKSETPEGDEHVDDCVADFMKTSQSYYDLYYGSTYIDDIGDGIFEYVRMKQPEVVAKIQSYHVRILDSAWIRYSEEIDSNRPVILSVDTDGDGSSDHSVLGIGYDDNLGKRRYACYNTWDTSIHWYNWNKCEFGTYWGINQLHTWIFKSAPNKPSIPTGTIKGKAGKSYEYITSTTDDDGDTIKYGWNWTGGFTVDEWTPFYDSGETCTISHSWRKGIYMIRVIAQDFDSGKSDWSDPLVVSMPKNKQYINTPYLNFLEDYPRLFPLLRQILDI